MTKKAMLELYKEGIQIHDIYKYMMYLIKLDISVKFMVWQTDHMQRK